jgi:hypothetical protein
MAYLSTLLTSMSSVLPCIITIITLPSWSSIHASSRLSWSSRKTINNYCVSYMSLICFLKSTRAAFRSIGSSHAKHDHWLRLKRSLASAGRRLPGSLAIPVRKRIKKYEQIYTFSIAVTNGLRTTFLRQPEVSTKSRWHQHKKIHPTQV